MRTVIDNENKKVNVSEAVYAALKSMRLDEMALINDIAGRPHMIIIANNFL